MILMHFVLCHLHGKLLEFSFDAAMSHTHPGQRRSDVSCTTCKKKKGFIKKRGRICTFIKAKKLQSKNLWQETQKLAVARLSTLKYCDFLIVGFATRKMLKERKNRWEEWTVIHRWIAMSSYLLCLYDCLSGLKEKQVLWRVSCSKI